MPRKLRPDFPGARHHVFNRGANRIGLFPTAKSRRYLLERVATGAARYRIDVHAYALLHNHFHLALTSGHGRLGDFMRWVMGAAAQRINGELARESQLCRGRYGSVRVQSDAHWRHLVAYIHRNDPSLSTNPLRTSHGAYLDAPPDWLRVDEHLYLFGGRQGYLAYLESMPAPGPMERCEHALADTGLPLVRTVAADLVGGEAAAPVVARWLAGLGLAESQGCARMDVSRSTYRRLLHRPVDREVMAAVDRRLARRMRGIR